MSFAQPKQPHRRNVPLAPMLDMMFLLLIFFVVTASIGEQERLVEINLPSAESSEAGDGQRSQIVINIRADGEIVMGAGSYGPEELRGVLAELVADFPDERVVIRGDAEARHGRIMAVFDAAQAAGVRHIDVATVRRAEEEADAAEGGG